MTSLHLSTHQWKLHLHLNGKDWTNCEVQDRQSLWVYSCLQGSAFDLRHDSQQLTHQDLDHLVQHEPQVPLSTKLTGHYCYLRILSTQSILSSSEDQSALKQTTRTQLSIEVHCDRLCSFPLFYFQNEQELWLSDDLLYLVDQLRQHQHVELEPLGLLSMWRSAQLVSGIHTVWKDIKQSQASDLLLWNDGQHTHKKGEIYTHQEDDSMMLDSLKSKLKDAARIFTQRLIDYAQGAQIVVPLSGGFDSRLVLTALVEAKYPNLFAFTYGRHHSGEVKLSEKIAQALNVPWCFVQYSPQKWKAWQQSPSYKALFDKARRTSVLAHIQDPMAINQLVQEGVIQKNSVIACGHSGDVHAGSLIDQKSLQTELSRAGYIELLSKKYFRFQADIPLIGSSESAENLNIQLKDKLNQELSLAFIQNLNSDQSLDKREYLIDELERWFAHERCSKYLLASMRAYELFGLRWWLPLWDDAFTQVWMAVPLKYRGRFAAYHEFVNEYFEEVSRSPAPQASVRSAKPQPISPLKRWLLKSKLIQTLRFRMQHPFAWYALIPLHHHLLSKQPQEHINVHLIQEEIRWWKEYNKDSH